MHLLKVRIALSIGFKCFKQVSHRRVIGLVADQHKRVCPREIIDVTRGPT